MTVAQTTNIISVEAIRQIPSHEGPAHVEQILVLYPCWQQIVAGIRYCHQMRNHSV
jgi:hypothetical protein